MLAACSSNEVDPEDLPAELVKFQQTLKIKRVWRKGVGDETEFLRLALRPATDGRNIYAAAHDGRVVAFDAATGKRAWRVKTDVPLSGGPATDGNIVVVGSSDGDVVALDAEDGSELWRIGVTSEVLASPVVGQKNVIVRTVNGKLAAFSEKDGTQNWSVQQSMPRLSVRGTASPVITRDLVISGFDNGRVAAYAIEDGAVVWDVIMELPSGRTAIERLADVNAGVEVAGGDVYAVGFQGRLGAIALESGQLIWTREMSSYSGLALDAGAIFVADQASELVALSRGSGRELWRKKDLRNRDITAPALFDGSIVVGDFEGYLHWFDAATGDLQARVRAGKARITSQPLVLNDILYVMNDAGRLYAYRARPRK
jgi:outer membrane protein assembly factor BamB